MLLTAFQWRNGWLKPLHAAVPW